MFAENLFYQIAILLSLSVFFGYLGLKLKQPLIIIFMLVGILVGPSGLGIVEPHGQFNLLVHIGIALLLFIVGLRLDVGLIRSAGPVALATGIGQIVFTSVFGLLIARAMGMPLLTAAYVAVALTFSSTIIIVKLLSDKKELDSLHGQIAVGFLIVQDIAAILALVVLTTLGGQAQGGEMFLNSALLIGVKGFGLLFTVWLLAKYILPRVVYHLAYSQELLLLFAIAWAILFSSVAEILGFSKEVGAFLAGISLASTKYRDAIGSRLLTLRDFLLFFFFINLGAEFNISAVGGQTLNALLLSLFVLIGNPLIVLAIMGFMGYRRRTSFMAGLTVAQISEFSLILIALGVSLGHVSNETAGVVTLVGIVTIIGSTYLIIYSENIYALLRKPLKIFERKDPYRERISEQISGSDNFDFILIGLGNYGRNIGKHLLKRQKSFIGVDYVPGLLAQWKDLNVATMYGDVTDPEIFELLPLNKTKWIVSTIRSKEISQAIFKQLKKFNYQGKIALTAVDVRDASALEKLGVHVVLRPFRDASEQAVDNLTQAMELLPENIDWPVAFKEVRVEATFSYAGRPLKDIPLRQITGVAILAVSRAGKVHYEFNSEFKIFPGDRILIVGAPEKIKDAEDILSRVKIDQASEEAAHFAISKFKFRECPDGVCPSLSLLGFRQRYSVTVIGIQRGDERITMPDPEAGIRISDSLVILGSKEALRKLAESGEFIELSRELPVDLK